jgi:PAS domain S-box-containing protein
VLGRSPEELEGGAVGELVVAEDAERFASILRRVLAGESDPEREEIRFLGADGRTRVLEIAAYAPPEFLARGECVLNARDLTAWRTLEDRLRQAEKMEAVGRLAGGVAHDFNNLLTVILGHSELLFSQLAADSAAAGEVAEIERAARRAADLTRQLLAFGRRQLLQPKELDLNRVVRGLESMLRRLIEARITLVLELEPLPLPIHADRAQLETAIVNLALNGRDAMPAGGRLTFSTARIATSAEQAAALGLPVGACALLRVTDTGEGMPPEVREHAFEPFFTTKDVGRGTGLGLSAVLGIVEQSGGAVRLASELGVGTTFELYLPLLAVDSEPTPSAGFRVEAAPVPGEPLLLVVEDEPSIRQLLVTALGARGFRVLEAATTERALEIAAGAAGTIDLLVTDVVMPGHTGPELAAELRRAQPDLRVLYITGYSEEIVGRGGEPEPGSAVLGKPFTIERLVTRVRDLLAAEAVGGS